MKNVTEKEERRKLEGLPALAQRKARGSWANPLEVISRRALVLLLPFRQSDFGVELSRCGLPG